MADKCPICFSDKGTPDYQNFIWTDDPLLSTPAPHLDGIIYDEYLGFVRIKAQHIKELQDNRYQIETDLGLTHTVFTPIDITFFYKNLETYIYELRTSTENILTALGLTKEDYFNYDKDGNDMRPGNHQINWTEIPFPVYHLRQYQSKAIHLEELRHFIQVFWEEKWAGFPDATYQDDSVIWTNPIVNILHNWLPAVPLYGNKGDWNSYGYGEWTKYISWMSSNRVFNLDGKLKIISERVYLYTKTECICSDVGGAQNLGIGKSLINISPYNGVNIPLKTTSMFSFVGTDYVYTHSTDASGTLIITVFINNYHVGINKIISYGFSDIPTAMINLSAGDFASFNRNLYNDLVSLYGVPTGAHPMIDDINIRMEVLHSQVAWTPPVTLTATRQASLDNIKFT